MAKKKNRTPKKMCETCAHFLAIGEGDHICDYETPILVLEDYTPTDDYFCCDGKNWEEM